MSQNEKLQPDEFYLNHPQEPFSLRFHRHHDSDQAVHWAEVKSQPETASSSGELEARAAIEPDLYSYYYAFTSEPIAVAETLSTDKIIKDVLDKYQTGIQVTVRIVGRSGSGKSTIVRQICEQLRTLGISTDVLSTDDYHRGGTWLRDYNNGEEWQNWDSPIVYDTATMASDITKLRSGQKVPRRQIDFGPVETVYDGYVEPVDVLLIEGIYAGCDDFADLHHLTYEVPTPLATCIGRRLLRDLIERPQFADVNNGLMYMLSVGEPTYRSQNHIQ